MNNLIYNDQMENQTGNQQREFNSWRIYYKPTTNDGWHQMDALAKVNAENVCKYMRNHYNSEYVEDYSEGRDGLFFAKNNRVRFMVCVEN